MAKSEHLAKLMEGVEAWNKWRQENPDVELDFREADLRVTKLSGAHYTERTSVGRTSA